MIVKEWDMGNRIRRHSDPFQCRVAITIDNWLEAYYAHGQRDIWLDLGCGKGEFLAELAEMYPAIFFMGIDVRRRIGEKFFPKHRYLPNLLLFHGNANLSIPSMMGQWKVQKVFINFPDPCDHKPRYMKRRLVNERLVDGLCQILAPGGSTTIKTDHKDLFEDMDALLSVRLEPITNQAQEDSAPNVLSEWENECRMKSVPVYSRDYRLSQPHEPIPNAGL